MYRHLSALLYDDNHAEIGHSANLAYSSCTYAWPNVLGHCSDDTLPPGRGALAGAGGAGQSGLQTTPVSIAKVDQADFFC